MINQIFIYKINLCHDQKFSVQNDLDSITTGGGSNVYHTFIHYCNKDNALIQAPSYLLPSD